MTDTTTDHKGPPPARAGTIEEISTSRIWTPPSAAAPTSANSNSKKPSAEAKPPIVFKTAADFCGEYEPISYAIEPFVRSSSLYTLTAKTGSGKTAFLIMVALAVATGRGDLIGRTVKAGRVVFVTAENPDDFRMRLMVAAFVFNIDFADLAGRLIVLDRRAPPEDLIEALKGDAKANGPLALVIVDTLAAFYDGADSNNPTEAGEFMRRLRPLTQIAGRPSVIVAAHPVKNAGDDNLIPFGAGAILNEVDGNLTLRKQEGGATLLHWQGKLRGVDFEPVPFRFELLTSPDVKDDKGRDVQLPVLRPSTEEAAEAREKESITRDRALLKAMRDSPGATFREWADTTDIPKSAIERRLARFAKTKLVTENGLGKWSITPAGIKAIEDQP